MEGEAADAFARGVADEWRSVALDPLDRALCEYAEKLTRAPASMEEADVARLRSLGLDDVAIHDAIQVIAYFNYVNRVADAIHLPLERW